MTEKIILTARSLNNTIDALIQGQAIVAFANVMTGRSFHADVFAFRKLL